MNVLLTMTFAGSLMMAVYILLRLVLDEKFYPTLRHVCLSISMVYFLIPFPLFWEGYQRFLKEKLGIQTRFSQLIQEGSQIQIKLTNIMELTNKGRIVYIQNKNLLLFLFFTIVLAFIVFDRQLRGYLKARKLVLKDSVVVTDSELLLLFEKCKAQVGVKQKVSLHKWDQKASPFTMGIFKPCIVVTEYPLTHQDYEMIFLHELYHIKNHDVFKKILVLITMAMNWYNPIVYFLRNEMNLVFELICDESLLKDKDMKFCRRYGSFIIDMATENFEQSPNLSAAMSKPGKEMKHRLKTAFSEQKKNKRLFFVLMIFLGVIGCFNSITILAYEPIQKVFTLENDTIYGESNYLITQDPNLYENIKDIVFDFDKTYNSVIESNVSIEICFQDSIGNQYEVLSVMQLDNQNINIEQLKSNKDYLEGYYIKHIPGTDDSCEIIAYKGIYSVIEKKILVNELYSRTVYFDCFHGK